MPRGGIRPRRIDGSTDHLLKPKWKQGRTRTIRVPVVLAEQLLEIAHRLDSGESLDLTQDNETQVNSHSFFMTQDNRAEDNSRFFELTQDNNTSGSGSHIELTQDNKTDLEQIRVNQAQAIALLQSAITSKNKGGSYAANNATGMRRLVEQALALLGQ